MENDQKNIFLNKEGDNWFNRNLDTISGNDIKNDKVISIMESLNIRPGKVLEIGCANGYRLNEINKKYNCEVFGIEPSAKAVEAGIIKYSNINLAVGTADKLPYKEKEFDLLIFGFCLYLCDRHDLFKIAAEADRVLQENGEVIILDFCTPFPYSNKYSHTEGVTSYKMDYSKMFLWNPDYHIRYKHIFSHNRSEKIEIIDDRICLDVLKKMRKGYIKNPF